MKRWLHFLSALLYLAVSCPRLIAQQHVEPGWNQDSWTVARGGDPACPGNGSCCVGHGAPGCSNASCCNTVCDADFTCCFGWSIECAALADSLCGSVCAGTCPSTGDCCTSHSGGGCENTDCCDRVCLSMPACCESGWSAACAERAGIICDECGKEPTFVCPQPGECCAERLFETGCERVECCKTVCGIDDYCCNTEWDFVCANMAADKCYNVCDCEVFGNFDDDSALDLRDTAVLLNCFSGAGSVPVASTCACADYDGDGDADLDDFGVFADLIDQ